MNKIDKNTVPAMPAAIQKKHRPTIQFTMPVELEEKKNVGRYCMVRESRKDRHHD